MLGMQLHWNETVFDALGDLVFVQSETDEHYLALAVASVLRPFVDARLAVDLLVDTLHIHFLFLQKR